MLIDQAARPGLGPRALLLGAVAIAVDTLAPDMVTWMGPNRNVLKARIVIADFTAVVGSA